MIYEDQIELKCLSLVLNMKYEYIELIIMIQK